MEFKGIKMIPILELGLSQIYLDKSKIEAVEEWFKPHELSKYEPLPVYNFVNDTYTLTDGHSRCYVAYKLGIKHIPVVYDNDDIVTEDMGNLLYSFAVQWCHRFHLKNISHLEQRIIFHEKYEQLWNKRCKSSYNLLTLTSKKERTAIQEKFPDLFLYGSSEDLSTLYFENLAGDLFLI